MGNTRITKLLERALHGFYWIVYEFTRMLKRLQGFEHVHPISKVFDLISVLLRFFILNSSRSTCNFLMTSSSFSFSCWFSFASKVLLFKASLDSAKCSTSILFSFSKILFCSFNLSKNNRRGYRQKLN